MHCFRRPPSHRSEAPNPASAPEVAALTRSNCPPSRHPTSRRLRLQARARGGSVPLATEPKAPEPSGHALPSAEPSPAAANEDPELSAQSFVERNEKEAEERLKALTAEAEQLRARLNKLESGIKKWENLVNALKTAQQGPVTSTAVTAGAEDAGDLEPIRPGTPGRGSGREDGEVGHRGGIGQCPRRRQRCRRSAAAPAEEAPPRPRPHDSGRAAAPRPRCPPPAPRRPCRPARRAPVIDIGFVPLRRIQAASTSESSVRVASWLG